MKAKSDCGGASDQSGGKGLVRFSKVVYMMVMRMGGKAGIIPKKAVALWRFGHGLPQQKTASCEAV